MKRELQDYLEQFAEALTKGKYDSYMPVLRNSFLPFLENKFTEKGVTIEDFFKKIISADYIIDGGVEYINSSRIISESAIDKYLTATNEFFRNAIFPKWPSCPLTTVENFKVFYEDIFKNCGKELKQHTPRAHLDEKEYKKIIYYLKELNENSSRNFMAKTVIPLILLYGFKIGTIAELSRNNFNRQRRTIEIIQKNQKIELELPYQIFLYVEKIYDQKLDDQLLFATAKNQRLISDYFDVVISNYNKISEKNVKITLEGLAKYAVINMFYKGMDPTAIRQISGMKDVGLKYCQQEAWKRRKLKLNGHVNSLLRDMDIYNDYN